MKKTTHSFDLHLNIPSYYLCSFPLFDLHLQRATGVSLPSLVANAQMFGIHCTFIKLPDLLKTPIWYTPDNFFQTELDIFQITEQQTTSLKEGWEQLQQRTASGEPVIVTGTTYELPYSHDYHNPRYLTPLLGTNMDSTVRQSIAEVEISDHYVAVTHCDQSEVFIYDPVPHQFKGTVAIDTFTNFWQGAHQFKEFIGARGYNKLAPYRMIDVSLATQYQEWEIKELAQMVLTRVCTAFLAGRTKTTHYRHYLSGIAINTYLQELFATYNTTQIDSSLMLAKSLFEVCLSRYFLRDFIHDLCDKLSFPFQQQRERIDHILAQWEQVHKTFVSLNRKGIKNHDQPFQTFRSLLADVSANERRLHEELLDQLSSFSNLPKN